MNNFMKPAIAAILLASACGSNAQDGGEHPAVKRSFDLPPSAELIYTISANQRGLALKGDATITWHADAGKYAASAESRVAIFGKLTENRSSGTIDAYGLAPAEFYDKRIRKDPVTATFDRDAKKISFSDGDKGYPIKGGEQDRVSISWQLVAVARAAKDKFKAGSEWKFFVVGPRDADAWTFRVIGTEKVQTGLGEIEAVHVARGTPPNSREQSLDMWLAPSNEWYPVKLRFSEGDRSEVIEQTLQKITKK